MKPKIPVRVLSFLLLLCLVWGTVPTMPVHAAEPDPDSYVVHHTNGGSLHVRKADGMIIYASPDLAGDLEIPKEVAGVTVRGILYYIRSDEFDDLPTSIAFSKNRELTSVSIPGTIKEIPNSVFYGCENLRKVTLNEGTVSVLQAFSECPIEEIVIPNSLEKITETFFGSPKINFIISGNHPHFSTDAQNLLYNKDKTSILLAGDRTRADYSIPDSVTQITAGVFTGNKVIENIVLSPNVETIDGGAFSNCTNLKTVTISADYAFIGHYAFSSCTSLTKIDLPRKKIVAYNNVFQNCTSLKTITLPPEGSLGLYCFADSGLKRISIPKDFNVSAYYTFGGCHELETVVFEEGFNGKQGTGMFAGCENMKSMTIPASLTDIPFGMFFDLEDDFGRKAPQNLTIYGAAGSEAGRFAKEEGIPFVATSQVKLPFTDADHWAKDAIAWSYHSYVMSGVTTTSFAPDTSITRAMFVAMLQRFAGSSVQKGYGLPFTDIESDRYYYYPVNWAYYNGIISGTSATAYSPGETIKRQDIATMLYRYHKFIGADVSARADLSGFTDANDISGYAEEAMAWAVANKIMVGYEGALTPQTSATRAETATMLVKCADIAGNKKLYTNIEPDEIASIELKTERYVNDGMGHIIVSSYTVHDRDTLEELFSEMQQMEYRQELRFNGSSIVYETSVPIEIYIHRKTTGEAADRLTWPIKIYSSKMIQHVTYMAPNLNANKTFLDKWLPVIEANNPTLQG